jgi:uncharacterized protein YjbI with pentapeptide repeats
MGEQKSQQTIFHLLFRPLFARGQGQFRERANRLSISGKDTKTDDRTAWGIYWQKLRQPWRTEPEIETKRQKFLDERRSIIPDTEHGIYPFKDIEPKLSRADIEWLLATHENRNGLMLWRGEKQRKHEGLDLRGADLRRVDLSQLPLAHLRGGLTWDEWRIATEEQRNRAAVLMEGADLFTAHLESAILCGAHLEGADLSWAQLEGADLYGTHLEGATLRYANLERGVLRRAHLEGTNLFRTNLEGANLSLANLAGADLRSAFFDNATTMRDVIPFDVKHGFISVADVRWAGVNLALLQWPRRRWGKVLVLGDEREARMSKTHEGKTKETTTRLSEYQAAVRANRQLATALQSQGLSELADHFAYRAQMLQREVWRRQQRLLKCALSWFLYLLAGYGYRPLRSLFLYLFVLGVFASAYYLVGPHLSCVDALVLSVTSFHGRGFFPVDINLHSLVTRLAALEAVVGLFIEISFIATFTQRFFGR